MMAISGLLLILFLVGHLAGNLLLLRGDEGKAFNEYAEFMSTNPGVQFTAWAFKVFFAVHIIWAIILILKNRAARGGQGYAKVNTSGSSASRYMGVLGSLIFVFLVIHLGQFWAQVHYGGLTDLYAEVVRTYQNPIWVAIYVFSMVVLAYHLWHGFQSAFQTLGVNNKKYTPIVKAAGYGYAVVIPFMFAIIPVIMFISK
ncbi:succinate dehydrogenase cytochrome b subunit [Algivirga pacifica]|uniref:Succinate dehydrogenase cytochrome b subunit n=2 Tax=Algivirga pacifica TaxID=1162670 RepID=A0ABP9CYL5_9BACT